MSLPTDSAALVAVVLLLGLKHGLDPDHLATIDGLARCNAVARPRLSRWAGLLFSLGHGTVVTLVALAVATVARDWQTPPWLDTLGTAVSIGFLLALGLANLAAVLHAPSGRVVLVAGIRARLLGGLARSGHPAIIAAIGAAFALSFDTMSQAAFFSLTGSKLVGSAFAVMLGIVFTVGMIMTDAANGVWIARLVRRSDAAGARASRAMGLAIALLSLAIAASGVARIAMPLVDERFDAGSAWIGGAVIAFTAASFVLALRVARLQPSRR